MIRILLVNIELRKCGLHWPSLPKLISPHGLNPVSTAPRSHREPAPLGPWTSAGNEVDSPSSANVESSRTEAQSAKVNSFHSIRPFELRGKQPSDHADRFLRPL
jgi:hypothetical protein